MIAAWGVAQLIQNRNFVVKIGPFREKGWNLGLGRHRAALDEDQILPDLLNLVLNALDLLSCRAISLV